MPYPNEHSARLVDPDQFEESRRTNGGNLYNRVDVPVTIAIIWGRKGDAWMPQALRFPTKDWTADEAKAWLKAQHVEYIKFEAAEKGIDMVTQFTKLLGKITEKAEDGLVAVISTRSVDREGDILESSGVDLTNYKKNKVVLWAHDHYIPAIGKALWIKAGKTDITVKIHFAQTAMGQEIKSLYADGILNAFSVGFTSQEWEELEKGGRKYTKWELLEFSAVNVPANADALAVRAAGMSNETRAAIGLDATQMIELESRIKELTDRVAALETLGEDVKSELEALGKAAHGTSYDEALRKLESATGALETHKASTDHFREHFAKGVNSVTKGK